MKVKKMKIEDYMAYILELCFKLSDSDLELIYYNIYYELVNRGVLNEK